MIVNSDFYLTRKSAARVTPIL